jgi:peptide/nickel transport system ATP-binding protein
MPQVGRTDERLTVIRGQVPLPHQMPPGCRFADRCDYAIDACRAERVPLHVNSSTEVRCIRASDLELRGTE